MTDLDGDRTVRADGISKRQVSEALRNLRRRFLVYYLVQNDGEGDLADLSVQIAAWERDTTDESVPDRHRKSVYSALHQTHLPRLEQIGLVEYDRIDMRVELTDRARNMDLYLAADAYTANSWPLRYLAVSVCAAVVVLLWWLEVHPFSMIPSVVWLAGIVATFSMLAVTHSYVRRRWCRRFQIGNPDFLIEFDDE